MSAPLRIALVGYGNMGRNWARVIQAAPGFELVAIIEPVWGDLLPAAQYYSPGQLRDVALDAVIIASPTDTHAVNARTCPAVPLLVEKPLAATQDDAHALADLPIVVGHVERFNPALAAARSALPGLGKIIHATATRIGGYPAQPTGDVVRDLAVHDLDILRLLLGPLRVEGAVCHETRGRCDTAEVSLVSERGATATVHVDWIAPVKARTLRVTCERGAVFLDYVAQTCAVVGEDRERRELPVCRVEPLTEQLRAFGDYVRTGHPGSLATVGDGIAAVALAERAAMMGRKEWV